MKIFSSFIVALFLLTGLASAEDNVTDFIWGKVTAISDGDTIEILTDKNERTRVQLAYIDAPDFDKNSKKAQPFHKESKEALEKLIKGKDVIVEAFKTDKYGRIEGMVFLDKLNVNLEMVRRGFAEIYHPVRKKPQNYKKYYTDQLFEAQRLAKEEKAGIWSNPSYISPYKWRRRKK